MPDPEDSVDEPSDELRPRRTIDPAGGRARPPRSPTSTGRRSGRATRTRADPTTATTTYADEGFADGTTHAEDRYPAGRRDRSRPADDDYPDFPAAAGERGRPGAAARAAGPVRSGHRGLGDWRGGHRSDGGRRGVSIGVIVALVAVVVVVGTVILWSFFGDALSHRSHSAAARCVGGKETVAVIADPSIADHVQQFAESFNSSAGPVGDHCMVLSVKPAGSDAVVDGFIGKWPAELGGQPALWIPGSSISAARLAAADGPENDQRQPFAGDVAGGARRAARTAAGPRPTRTGRRCPACKPTRMRWRA